MINLSEYINPDGFVTVERNANYIPGEGNGWLQTGLAFACGMYVKEDFSHMLARCWLDPSCPLIWRSPYKHNADDNQRCDDYWGALLLDRTWAARVLDFAENSEWCFSMHEKDHGKPEYRFDRFLSFPPFIRLCAGKNLSALDSAILVLTILWDAFHINQADGNIKAFCRIHACERHILFAPLAAAFWRKRIREKYGTIGKSWAEYFGNTHPLVAFK